MNCKLVSPAIAAALLALGAPPSLGIPEPAGEQPFTFFCATDGPTPVTAIRLDSEPEGNRQVFTVLTWEEQHFPAAERVCQQAAGRLQAYALESDPNEFLYTTGELNGLPIICLQSDSDAGCSDRVLLSLAADQDAKVVLQSMTERQIVRTRGDFPVSIRAFPFSIPFFSPSF